MRRQDAGIALLTILTILFATPWGATAAETSEGAVLAAREGLVIRRAERLVLHIPFANDRVRRHMHRANTQSERVWIYRIELADGTVGWGEALLDRADRGPGLTGRNAVSVMYDDRADFGFQMAALDAVGRACGVPVWQLLGTRRRASVPIAWWAIDMPPEDLAAELAHAVDRGYTSAKLKARPWHDLLAQIEAVHAAVPAGFTVVFDYNGFLLDAAQAERFLLRLDDHPLISGHESPFYLQRDTAGAARLKEVLNKNIYEHFHNNVLQERATDGFAVDSNYGPLGMTLGRDAVLDAFGLPYWKQMVGTGISTAFMVQLGAVMRQTGLPSVTCHELYEHDLLAARLEVRNGTIAVPDGPGLGVDIDREAIARYRVEDNDIPTPKDHFLARPRTIRIHIPPAGDIGTVPVDDPFTDGIVLEFASERDYYPEFLKGKYPGFRPGTRLEVIESPAGETAVAAERKDQ